MKRLILILLFATAAVLCRGQEDIPLPLKGFNVFAGAGYGRIITGPDFGSINIVDGNVYDGLEYELGFDYITWSGVGFGLVASEYTSYAAATYDTYNGKLTLDFKSACITFSEAYWIGPMTFSGSVGLGAYQQTSTFACPKISGPDKAVGPLLCCNADFGYRLNNNASVGVRINIKEMYYYIDGDSSIYGYESMGIGVVYRQIF